MTVVINYKSKGLSVIISDDRISYGEKQEYGYEDGFTKLVNLTEMGWASGTGLSTFLDFLKEELAHSYIRSIGDMKDVYSKCLVKAKEVEPFFAKYIDESTITLSWAGTNNNSIDIQLGILDRESMNSENIKILNDNQILILYPSDYIEDKKKVSAIIEKYGTKYEFDGNCNKLLLHMLSIFKQISSDSEGVGEHCDVGVFALTEDSHFKMKLSGKIDKLIEGAKNGDLESYVINDYNIE